MRRLHDNGVCEGGKPEGRLLLFKTREMMRSADKEKADISEFVGYVSPVMRLLLSLFSTATRAL